MNRESEGKGGKGLKDPTLVEGKRQGQNVLSIASLISIEETLRKGKGRSCCGREG